VWFLFFTLARNKQKAVLFTNPLGKACYELNEERVTWIILVICLVFFWGGKFLGKLMSFCSLNDGFDGPESRVCFRIFETNSVKV